MSLNGDYKTEFSSDVSTNDKHIGIKPLGIYYIHLPTLNKFWINTSHKISTWLLIVKPPTCIPTYKPKKS